MTTAAGLRAVLTVPKRFRGPEGTANGGWIAGTLANSLTGAGHSSPVEVTLHKPVPLETRLGVAHVGNAVALCEGDAHLVEAIPVAQTLTPPPFVPFIDAARAEAGFAGLSRHPMAGCFACGLREPGDGLRIFPGPIEDTGLVAAGWRVPVGVTDEDGVVPDSVIWAALDCVTGWVNFEGGEDGGQPVESALLGRLTAQVYRRVYPLGTYSVVARAAGREGRKLFGESAVYEVDGTLVAAARATWIVPR
jgi:acyl-coenzyme A thioesterase PaaI-like protein